MTVEWKPEPDDCRSVSPGDDGATDEQPETGMLWTGKMVIFARDATVDDLGDISSSLDCFTSNFSRTVRDTAKVTVDY